MNKFLLQSFLWLMTIQLYAQKDTICIIKSTCVLPADSVPRSDNQLIMDNGGFLSPSISFDPAELSLEPEKNKSSSFRNSPFKPFILPAGLITYGVLAQFTKPLQKIDDAFNRNVNDRFNGKWEFDDYTQLAPSVSVYALELFGVQPKHSLLDRTFVMLVSHSLMLGIVRGSKHIIESKRPSGITGDSFPSGHTTTAFTGAHVLYKEYKDVTPWIPIAGYTVACLTGTMRVVNGMHWFSDVVAGAGVGILSAEVAYLLLPVFQRTCNKAMNKNLVISPEIAPGHYGAGFALTF